eukprot:c18637_g1_i1 orf=737-1984(+)
MGKPVVSKGRPERAYHAFVEYRTEPQQLVVAGKKKKKPGARLWMRIDANGNSELLELDRNMIMDRAVIPARDLRTFGPVFSHSSNILAREKAMVVNLEFIKAIVTAQEVLILDPTNLAVLPFIDQLRQQLPLQTAPELPSIDESALNVMTVENIGHWLPSDAVDGLQNELPFEFRVLEIALEVVCSFLDTKVSELERNAYPALDELTRNVSTSNLEHVRSLKSHLTLLLARVQKVRDEMEHLLDDDDDMAQLYLTRKLLLAQQAEAISNASPGRSPHFSHVGSRRSSNSLISTSVGYCNVEELEMLLEAYFMQVDGTRNKLLTVREYIDDTEDYVNIQLDHQRNELIQLHITLTIASFSIAIAAVVAGIFGMNIPCPLYNRKGLFEPIFSGVIILCAAIFFVILNYSHREEHIGS